MMWVYNTSQKKNKQLRPVLVHMGPQLHVNMDAAALQYCSRQHPILCHSRISTVKH